MAIKLDQSFIKILNSSGEKTVINIGSDLIIDPCHGRDDLSGGIVRAVSKTAFEADAARLLRAVRLAAELDFIIDVETEGLIRQHSNLITGVAPAGFAPRREDTVLPG
jgi:tRNA nucleotidyltransferase/poly(A) polymerase